MSLHTNRVTQRLRRVARRLGLTQWIATISNRDEYERRFARAMQMSVVSGDVVWDVGANKGHYTRLFSEWAGPTGRVYAIEPSPRNQEALATCAAGNPRIEVVKTAISNRSGVVEFLEAKNGTTSRIAGPRDRTSDKPGRFVQVQVNTADNLIESRIVATPNFIKIDTEGHELDVLEGMQKLLVDTQVRAIFIEVHFRQLEARGQPNAPRQIERRLTESGFTVRWCDSSHISALRPALQ